MDWSHGKNTHTISHVCTNHFSQSNGQCIEKSLKLLIIIIYLNEKSSWYNNMKPLIIERQIFVCKLYGFPQFIYLGPPSNPKSIVNRVGYGYSN